MNKKQIIEKLSKDGGSYETRLYRYYRNDRADGYTIERIAIKDLDTTAALEPEILKTYTI